MKKRLTVNADFVVEGDKDGVEDLLDFYQPTFETLVRHICDQVAPRKGLKAEVIQLEVSKLDFDEKSE